MPAKSKGLSAFFFSSSLADCSLALRISCLSLVKLSSPTLSTTLKNLPSPACLSALMSSAFGCCVIAVENKANSLFFFFVLFDL